MENFKIEIILVILGVIRIINCSDLREPRTLNHPSICKKEENYTEFVKISYLQPYEVNRPSVWSKRPNIVVIYRVEYRYVEMVKTRRVPICCDGYEEEFGLDYVNYMEKRGSVIWCEPECRSKGFNYSFRDGLKTETLGQTCFKGVCTKPGLCQCNEGYTGKMCLPNCIAYSKEWENSEEGRNKRCENGKCNTTLEVCDCNEGFNGDRCQWACTNNTFGKNCDSKCNCTSIGSDGTGNCNHVDGACVCDPNRHLVGHNCDQSSDIQPCPKGTYGSTIKGEGGCKTCTCKPNSDCNDSPRRGLCKCKPNFEPDLEEDVRGKMLPLNYYKRIAHGYEGCNCPNGLEDPNCDPPCSNNSTFGHNCKLECDRKCSAWNEKGDYIGIRCNGTDGRCSCPVAVDQKLTPYFCKNKCANAKECQQNIHRCHEFWMYRKCTCSGLFYCVPWQQNCSSFSGWKELSRPYPLSYPTTGHWSCDISAYKGILNCPCQNGGTCVPDNNFGYHCSCPSGFTGEFCKTSCSKYSWSYNDEICKTSCPEGFWGKNCTDCIAGFTGELCQTPCPKGSWGENCMLECPTFPFSMGCNLKDGRVKCVHMGKCGGNPVPYLLRNGVKEDSALLDFEYKYESERFDCECKLWEKCVYGYCTGNHTSTK